MAHYQHKEGHTLQTRKSSEHNRIQQSQDFRTEEDDVESQKEQT